MRSNLNRRLECLVHLDDYRVRILVLASNELVRSLRDEMTILKMRFLQTQATLTEHGFTPLWNGTQILRVLILGVVHRNCKRHHCRMRCLKILRTISVLAVTLAALWFVLLWVPEWMVNQYLGAKLSRLDYTKAVDDYRKTLAQILGGFALLIGLYFTWRTTRSTEDGRITDRFSKAVEQLGACNKEGKKQLEPRLGGIYALERIARDSQRDRWPIIEILCAYVRMNAPRKYRQADPNTSEPVGPEPERRKPDADIEAIMRMLSTISNGLRREDQLIFDLNTTELYEADLSNSKLNRADLSEAHLERADLSRAQLKNAVLKSAYLDRAKLTKVDLEGANLYRAKLTHVDLYGANLKGADLSEANLRLANLKNAVLGFSGKKATNFRGAVLTDTNLKGVDLRWVSGLTGKQISRAMIDENTRLPDVVIQELGVLENTSEVAGSTVEIDDELND